MKYTPKVSPQSWLWCNQKTGWHEHQKINERLQQTKTVRSSFQSRGNAAKSKENYANYLSVIIQKVLSC